MPGGKLKLLAIIPVVLVAIGWIMLSGDGQRTVTAHFDRAVAVYPGTDLRVMGVKIGKVKAVVPDGNSVRVEMTYDPKYKLPANAQAAVVTPTLVADRYVQVFPPYGGGAVMGDHGDIPLERTETPIELDRMFKALDDLSTTLGPAAGSTHGALANLLKAGTKALGGNGQLGAETIRNMSGAVEAFARNRGPLFANVRALAEITDTLAQNDRTVNRFLKDLASVSGQLSGERDDLSQMLDSLAGVLGTVQDFIHQNRSILGDDLKLLSSVLDRVDREKDTLGLVVQKGSVAMSNLAVAFEPSTGTFGSRVQVAPGIQMRPDQFLCQMLNADGAPPQACAVVTTLLTPLIPAISGAGAASTPAAAPGNSSPATVDGQATSPLTVPGTLNGVRDLAGSLASVPDTLSSIVQGALK